MYAITVFLFILGLITIWGFGTLVYQKTYFSKLSKETRLPAWEQLLYYAIAAYPFVGYVIMMKANSFLEEVALPDSTILTYKLLFTTGHVALSVLSVAVIRYQLKRSKWHVLFAASTLWAGSIFFTGSFVFMMM